MYRLIIDEIKLIKIGPNSLVEWSSNSSSKDEKNRLAEKKDDPDEFLNYHPIL